MSSPFTSTTDFAIVITTIGEGAFLDDYVAQLKMFDELEKVTFFVIADRKTPARLFKRCKELKAEGVKVVCPDLKEQVDLVSRFGVESIIPWDSDQRRNLGFLMAYESGRDVVISIDDDNYPRADSRFFAGHAIVAEPPSERLVLDSSTGWFNVCSLMATEPVRPIFPRGYPYAFRTTVNETKEQTELVSIAVNAGLWLHDPDVDSITRLNEDVKTVTLLQDETILSRDTWTPINSQNTALRRAAIPSFYFIPMGRPILGLSIDRYGDIFGGYFCEACVKHLDDYIRVGTPIVDHRRNRHVLMNDLIQELVPILVTDQLTNWLHSLKLEGSTYTDTYLTLSHALDEISDSLEMGRFQHEAAIYFHEVATAMRCWTGAVQRIDNNRL